MSERDNILTRIREALTVRAKGSSGSHSAATGLPTPEDHRRVLPRVSEDFDGQLALFAKNAAELCAEFKTVKDAVELSEELRALRDREQWRRVAAHPGTLANVACAALELPVLGIDSGYEPAQLEMCDAGITECDALVAQTGSVMLTSRSAGGRALSVLPPHHVVIARRTQLVPDLPGAFALLRQKYGTNYPSMISFVTGPSRTGDIERILVLGAHGPKKLTIFMI
jgi:L-lactate dehydrogenase complex protein LldG